MRTVLFTIACSLALQVPVQPVRAETSNFIKTYVEARGGCSMNTLYEGTTLPDPFGKPAVKWTDEDLQLLRSTMAECFPDPNGFDLSEERDMIKKVTAHVSEARETRENEQRAVAAQRQLEADERARTQERLVAQQRAQAKMQEQALAQQRAVQQEAIERRATTELQSYADHLMSAAEIERAQRIAQEVPNLAARVSGLLAAQVDLKKRTDAVAQQQRDREATIRQVEAEKRRRALAEKYAAIEAEAASAKKKEEFENALPSSCKEADASDRELSGNEMTEKMVKANALAAAGDTEIMCRTARESEALAERTRTAFVQCYKELEKSSDSLAREKADSSLQKAIDLREEQQKLSEDIKSQLCK